MMESSTTKISTQAKISQIKNNKNVQNSTQPLKFRSFDAFYQYYSKKQTYENSQRRNSVSQQPITNTTLKDKKESLKNEKLTPQKDKPTFTFTTEDYNIKGRVKRLCEIFQKARKDANSLVNLEKTISKNKTIKVYKSPVSSSTSSPGNRTNVVTYLELNTPKSKEQLTNAVQTDLKHKNGVENKLNKQQCVLTYVKDNNNGSNNTNNNTQVELSSFKQGVNFDYALTNESRFNTQFKNNVENNENLLQQSSSMEKNSDSDSLGSLSTLPSDSFDNNKLPSMDELSNLLATHGISPNSNYCKSDTEGGFFDSCRSDNNALIDDILNRFMNDPDFCDSFFSKLENLNIYNQPGAVQFTRVLDELLSLVENENSGENSHRELSQEQKKDFEWFFTQPKVFNFNVIDRKDPANRSISSQSEDIDQKTTTNMKKVGFDTTMSIDERKEPEEQQQLDQDLMLITDIDNTNNKYNENNNDNSDITNKENKDNDNNTSNNNTSDNEENDLDGSSNEDYVHMNTKVNTVETNEVTSKPPKTQPLDSVETPENVLTGDYSGNEKSQTQVSTVLQPTNPMHMEYDLYDELPDLTYDLGIGNNGDMGDESPIDFDQETQEEPNPDLAKYFDWVKNSDIK